MIVPDYAGTFSALDAHPKLTITVAEAVAFMRDAGEPVVLASFIKALSDMIASGAVLVVHEGSEAPRYVLRSRLRFLRAMRESEALSWGA